MSQSIVCHYNQTPEAQYCIKKRGLFSSPFWRLKVQDLVRAFWLYHNMVDGIVVGVSARGNQRDLGTRFAVFMMTCSPFRGQGLE
jgi:hypothetical protein